MNKFTSAASAGNPFNSIMSIPLHGEQGNKTTAFIFEIIHMCSDGKVMQGVNIIVLLRLILIPHSKRQRKLQNIYVTSFNVYIRPRIKLNISYLQ